jgi:hypothetical protein
MLTSESRDRDSETDLEIANTAVLSVSHHGDWAGSALRTRRKGPMKIGHQHAVAKWNLISGGPFRLALRLRD